ncbi:ubiquinol-cytochrome c reductase core protein 2 [Lycorma delicatula]|uniref:ubiquinol-cytochrome c reductase core protein 2 n=1 Tax=Lycorma delicatula TaxID=130591 RepID=UPI003F50DF1B
MATNASKTHLYRALCKRHFTSAAHKYAGYYGDVNVTVLPNKIAVGTVESTLPISRISVVIKAGSRYDPIEAPGLNHVLRTSAGLTTSSSTIFGITRNIQQIGANISCTGSRDTLTYTLEATCDKIVHGLKFFKDVVVNQAFKPWELEDNIPRIKYELAALPPQAKAIDLLHKAAYRQGYGNPLFVKDFNISKIGSETLQHHVVSLFTSSRASVTGVGVSSDIVTSFASDLELPVGSGPDVPAVYYGGEVFEESNTGLTHAAIAVKAAGLKNKDAINFAVLRHALGGWSSIKWSRGGSLLAEAMCGFDKPVSVSALYAAHADSGLLGFIISAPSSIAKSAVTSAAHVLSEGKIPNDLIERAKIQLKNEILHAAQNGEELVADIGNQILLFDGNYVTPLQLANDISQVSASSVTEALSSFFKGKKALGVYGNLNNVPYIDEIK